MRFQCFEHRDWITGGWSFPGVNTLMAIGEYPEFLNVGSQNDEIDMIVGDTCLIRLGARTWLERIIDAAAE
ncbi:MAG: hypothetical protein H6905_07340 [Hyphomicrobiales bacterium]|nr:hypothetical protein [Hyphomicrobiales bacterium]